MKIDIGQILGVAALVKSLVNKVQTEMKGHTGAEKKAAVIAGLKEGLKLAEQATGKNLLDDAEFAQTLDDLVEAEVIVMKLKTRIQALIASAIATK